MERVFHKNVEKKDYFWIPLKHFCDVVIASSDPKLRKAIRQKDLVISAKGRKYPLYHRFVDHLHENPDSIAFLQQILSLIPHQTSSEVGNNTTESEDDVDDNELDNEHQNLQRDQMMKSKL